MTGVSPAHLTGMIMGMVTSFSPNWTRDWKSQLSSFSLRTEMIVYLSFLGALLPMVYWPAMTALVRRAVRAASRSACAGWVVAGLGASSASVGKEARSEK